MGVTIYLQGSLSPDGQRLSLPLSSCAVMLVVSYADPSAFRLAFVNTEDTQSNVSLPYSGLPSLHHEFVPHTSVPPLIHNVLLPAVLDLSIPLVRSGQCVVVRHVVRAAHAVDPSQDLTQLLGFRQGSLRMCAEVSGWTKLCEVELPYSVACLLRQVYDSRSVHQKEEHDRHVALPADLIKLEAHFEKPAKVHNDDRQRRSELAALQAAMDDPKTREEVVRNCRMDAGRLVLERVIPLPHGYRQIRVEKEGVDVGVVEGAGDAEQLASSLLDKSVEGKVSEQQVRQLVHSLSYLDVQFVHLYSEGVEMTIADLCLFSYFYVLLEGLQFQVSLLEDHLPRVLTWLRHMVLLPRLELASSRCAFQLACLKQALLKPEGKAGSSSSTKGGKGNSGSEGGDGNSIRFCKPPMDDVTEDDMELSRRCRTKYRALKPEVQQALTSMKDRGIEPVVGSHPRGSDVKLDWDSLPASVHPRQGQVPAKRVERKCQQLENLVTAVMEVARPGDVIVDFCSGGGHLGLAIAHLLPHCKVYLVENKEESLLRAQGRIAALHSNNVVLFQCNMDYFVGPFEVGVCLHACGSATDMVLHHCLHNQAAFVICPCCYGSIQQTHLLTYPRSRQYQEKQVTYKEFLTLGHAADQTEFNIALEQQGRQCMNLVDSDRAQLAREAGYAVTLTSLQPLTCSPKNNLLIGYKDCTAAMPT
ncbi:glutathione S-transferase C-terminal domain-containing protein-like [Babylonia areolata]|uniref:glutathione S-transferase C-terminal domain-containing protein-like n=1 Tax=Babylonia areolata TaxID=304850 RepID=UPI003FD63F8F